MRALIRLLTNSQITTLVLVLSMSLNASGQWTTITSGTTANLKQIVFPDSLTGYILTANTTTSIDGQILKTVDGGYTWNIIFSGHVMKSFDFLTKDIGVVLAQDTVYKTTDGGNTWTQFYSGSVGVPIMFHMNTADEWFYIAAQITSYTTDAGITWNSGSIFGTVPIVPTDFQFVNDSTVISVGWYAPKTIISHDKGLHWADLSYFVPMGSGSIWSVCFTDALTGFATGNSRILKSTDGGMNWVKIDSTLGFNINCIRYRDSYTIYGVGYSGGIAKTNDAGTTWTTEISGTTNKLNKIIFTNSHTAIAIGDTGTILMNSSILTEVRNAYDDGFSVYPNPINDLITITFPETNNYTLNIFNVLGESIFSITDNSTNISQLKIESLDYAKGIYFIQLSSVVAGSNKQSFTKKIIKQ